MDELTRREGRGLIAWFAANPIAANLLFLIIAVAGLATVLSGRLTLEIFPDIAPDRVLVGVAYPGAGPAEVEQAIVMPIEEKLHDLRGAREITASAAEGAGALTVEVAAGYDGQRLADEIRTRIDQIVSFPAGAERPVVEIAVRRGEAISLAVHGEVEPLVLQRAAERVREALLRQPGITQVELVGAKPYELRVELDQDALTRHGLGHGAVAQILRRQSTDLPGGSVRGAGGDILVRVADQARSAEALAALPVLAHADGRVVRLGEVARVRDALATVESAVRFAGAPAILVKVYRVGSQDVFAVAAAAIRTQAEIAAELPPGVGVDRWLDNSVWLRDRLDLLTVNAVQSLLLVVLILALTLGLRLALWVALGIPVSFLGAIALMPVLGVSVNMVSLFAFILALGIVVDDAIVVSEEVAHQHARGLRGRRAAVVGSRLVVVPVVFSVLTTVVAFAPMATLPGTFGKVFLMIPAIVIPILLFSLLESLWTLPGHLALHHDLSPGRPRRSRIGRAWAAVRAGVDAGLAWVVARLYEPALHACLRWRYATLAGFAAVAVLLVALLVRGTLPLTFFPVVEQDVLIASVGVPSGSSLAAKQAAAARLEAGARRLAAEVPDAVRRQAVGIGTALFPGGPGANAAASADLVTMMIELAPAAGRSVRASELARRWRALTPEIPGAVSVAFSSELRQAGAPLALRLAHGDLDRLRAAGDRLAVALAGYAGVADVADSLRPGKDELRLALTAHGRALGLGAADLGEQVRAAVHGAEVHRFARDRDEVRVLVGLPEERRRTIADLLALRIRTPDGAEHALGEVATLTAGAGVAVIRRVGRDRVVDVTADVDPARADARAILADLEARVLPAIAADLPGLRWSVEGEDRERREQLGGLLVGFCVALVAIYGLIAVPLKSWVQPVLIMAAIPMGLVGAALAHLAIGMPVSLMSLVGMVALSGVVVNDAIVMVDCMNRHRAEGEDTVTAIVRAGTRRFRAILLTTATTSAGLLPIILEPSPQAQFLAPTAVALGFGVAFATAVTLILLPAIVLALADLRRAAVWLVRG